MEPVIDLNCSTIECTSLSPNALIWQDILAQAMTGELVAAMNYAALSEICDDPEEVADALEHAAGERGHAAAFAAESLGLLREQGGRWFVPDSLELLAWVAVTRSQAERGERHTPVPRRPDGV